MENCNQCPKFSACNEMCPEVRQVLDDLSKAFYKSYYFEIPVQAVTSEYLNSLQAPDDFMLAEETKIHDDFQKKQLDVVMYVVENELSEKYRQIIYDYFFEKEDQKTLAKKYNVTQPTISFRIQQAVKEAQKHVRRYIPDGDVRNIIDF